MKFQLKRKPAQSEWKSFHVRPEDQRNVRDFYDEREARRYANSNAMRKIQEQLTLRAIEIAMLPLGARVIDAGCGSGFSSVVLRGVGYEVYPFDVIPDFVDICRGKSFDARIGDLRKFPFAGKFDGIFSISALQWVTAPNISEAEKVAKQCWNHLKKNGKAVLQFYPKSEKEALETARFFKQIGFITKLITDNPSNPRKRKVFILAEKR